MQRTTGREGWLRRVVHRLGKALLRPELDRIAEAIDALSAGSREEAAARAEFQRHLDTRMDQVLGDIERRFDRAMADLRELRDAYLVTRGEFETVRERLAAASGELGRALVELQREVELVRDRRLPAVERDLGTLQRGVEAVQRELEAVRDGGVPRLEAALATLQQGLAAVQDLGEELRDGRLPALAARTDALVERLHEDLAATSGLVERLAAGEPLRVAVEEEGEADIPEAVRAASVEFADAFRGTREEILGRVAEYLPLLAEASPVLDLGCGRGELLEALNGAAVAARGVDADAAMVASCCRRGLKVHQGEALATLRSVAAGSLGAVTAIHLVEHLPAAHWMQLVASAARALRPGGLLLVESPNPETLRVGGALFWVDPTHRAPVHPEALAFVVRTVGLHVEEVRRLHPFPVDQSLLRPGLPEAVRDLATRLEGWLSGARDYLLVARKPVG